jgi:hypothetical protein
MIVIGIILLLCAYLLPDVIAVPPGIIHVLTVLGWIGVVVGLIFLVFGHFAGRGVFGPRSRYWF